ncbi:MAG: hypothetical protein ACT4TC_08530 [Myxococcaceae bacterium]
MSSPRDKKDPPKRPPLDDSGFDRPARSLSDGIPPPSGHALGPKPKPKPKHLARPLGKKRVAAAAQPDAEKEAREQAKQAAKLREQMLGRTNFAGENLHAKQQALIAATPLALPEEEEPSLPTVSYDGAKPDPLLASRDLWKAVTAPVQSREGKRTGLIYRQAINQFGVGNNPRYEPEDNGASRAHIFVWDLSRAMGAEIPHFLGSRELSFVQTVDWIRYEGGDRCWLKCELARAIQAADSGMPVLAIPKDIKLRGLAVLRPEERTPDGKPLFAALSGNNVSLNDALGVVAAEFYFHA